VAWLELKRPLRPAACMAILAPLLPETHAPLTAAGKGIQGGRLLEMPDRLARALLQLAGGTDPARILNPVWQPHQLRFCFAEAEMDGGSKPAAPPPVQAAVTTEECNA